MDFIDLAKAMEKMGVARLSIRILVGTVPSAARMCKGWIG